MQLMERRETWGPHRLMEGLSARLNRLFRRVRAREQGEGEFLAAMDWSPSCDTSETEKEYRIRAELPKVKKEDVRVTLEDSVLTIQGERREEKEEKGVKVHRRELSCGHFMRQFTIPDDADEARVEATFKNGMLNVIIGRSPARVAESKQIPVH